MVRLAHLHDLAERFVRVRITRIDALDLNLFEFDYDLTFMVFFLSPEGKVYARYGGRDAHSPDARQSLEGLRYTMRSVLAMHQSNERAYAPRSQEAPKFIQQIPGGQRFGRCLHCHQVNEILNEDLKQTGRWHREFTYRYPLPDTVGLSLEVDRGNVVARVAPASPAARLGLQRGDVVQWLNRVPIHSQADAQYALDRAPAKGEVPLAWERGGEARNGVLTLAEAWRKHDITWRPSLQLLVPYLPLSGAELTAAEKQVLGLAAEPMALRHGSQLHSRARDAGIRAGDVIIGVDGRGFASLDSLREAVRSEFLVGDRLVVDLLRDGKRLRMALNLP